MKKTNAIRTLQQHKVEHQIVLYHYDDDKLDVVKIAEDNHINIRQIYKTLILKGDKTGLIVALVAGHLQLSFKALAKLSGNKKVAMLAVKDLLSNTGYVRGGCSPLGMKKLLPTYIDISAQHLDRMYVNAGQKGILVAVPPQALADLCHADWGSFCVES